MRIQHNIMAISAYRNYNTNTSALSKNLEKLSSGYKINRAGDDAAGLAISEKMRAQITGLNAAQKNVKDGISLVKTAEGAMQEIQDMLNRMDYLATQSANGTYQDEVDRENLNKEMEALKTEIDRIADSANFNGIKLLDGSRDAGALEDAQKAVDDAAAALEKAQTSEAAGKLTEQDVNDLILEGESTDVTEVGTKTIVEVDAADSKDPSFKISFDGVSHVHSGGAGKITLSIGDDDIELTEGAAGSGKELEGAAGTKFTGAQLAEAFKDKMLGGNTEWTDGNGNKYTVEVEDNALKFTATNNQTAQSNRHMTVTLTSDVTPSTTKATAGSWDVGTYTAGTDGTGAGATTVGDTSVNITASIGGTNVTFSATNISGKATADEFAEAVGNLTASVGGETKALSDFFDVKADAAGKITITSKGTGADADSVTAMAVTMATKQGTAGDATDDTPGTWTPETDAGGAATTWTAGADGYTSGLNGYVNHGTEEVVVSAGAVGDVLASTTLDLTGKLTDGAQIKLGDETYVILKGDDDSPYAKEVPEGAIKVEVAADASEEDIASKLSEAAANNTTFTVSHEGDNAKIGLKQLQAAKDTTDMSTRDKLMSYIGVSVVSTEDAEAAKEEAIEKAQATLDAAQAKLDALSEKGAKALNLQIGDTSDDFNQMAVKIGDMHVAAMEYTDEESGETATIKSIDIKTSENAQKAIDVIKNAINYVSSVRGDLGAYQNRLEHTANNLSVMAENIQDAESTIRDTDIAEEMMSYTKNNILVQSAQAMLAQANAVPQGVLQLLG